MSAVPRRKPSVVRRAMSRILPVKSAGPRCHLQHRLDRIAVGPPGRLHGPADPDGLGRRAENGAVLHLAAGPGRLAGRRDGADLHADLAAQPLHPLPARRARDDHRVVADVGQGEGVHLEVVDGEAGHLGLGKRAPHAVGVHHRPVEHGRRHEGLDGVAAPDLERHHGAERSAQVLLHHGDGEGHGLRIGEAFLTDEGGAHVGDDGHQVVVGQLGGVHELAHHALPVEPAHVQEREIGAAAAPGAEDPGADGEALDLLGGDRPHQSADGAIVRPTFVMNPPPGAMRARHRPPPSGRRADGRRAVHTRASHEATPSARAHSASRV